MRWRLIVETKCTRTLKNEKSKEKKKTNFIIIKAKTCHILGVQIYRVW